LIFLFLKTKQNKKKEMSKIEPIKAKLVESLGKAKNKTKGFSGKFPCLAFLSKDKNNNKY
jgi:hypothetical protein